jgi:2-polyprenyl-3-methyl-5-hydroxy-6-metoxy-1,4-benzoquinol methylase
MMDKNKLEEVKFQAGRAKSIRRIKPTPCRLFSKYKRNRFHHLFIKEFLFKNLGDLNNRYICDLGCGEGELSVIMAKFGAKILAIDISPELIEIAKIRADLDGVSSNIEFIIGDAENLNLNRNFDIVLSYGALHHMNIDKVVPKIYESLNKTGQFALVEPINMAPCYQKKVFFLAIKKTFTSPGEKPLTSRDFKIIHQYFYSKMSREFHLFGRIVRILPGSNLIDCGNSFIKLLLFIAGLFDFLVQAIFPSLKSIYRVKAGIYSKNI